MYCSNVHLISTISKIGKGSENGLSRAPDFLNQAADFGSEGCVTDGMHPMKKLMEKALELAYLYIKSTCLCFFIDLLVISPQQSRFYIHFIAAMSVPWLSSTQQVENPLDPDLSGYLSFDLLDHLDSMEPVLDITPDTLSMSSGTTFDWSSGIDPTLFLLYGPDDFVFETSPGNGSTSGKPAGDEQSLKEAILQLGNSMEARLAQIEDSIGDMGQRLTKVEETKKTQDIEYVDTAYLLGM